MKNLVSLISAVNGCQFAEMTFISEGGIPQYVLGKGRKVHKVVRGNYQIGYSYENAVNNRLDKIGSDVEFKAESLPWGSWIEGQENKLIENKGSLYLRYYKHTNGNERGVWFVDGRQASPEEFNKIMDYLRSKSDDSDKQTKAGLTENQVKPRTVKLSNIISLSVNHQVYHKHKEQPAVAVR